MGAVRGGVDVRVGVSSESTGEGGGSCGIKGAGEMVVEGRNKDVGG